MKFQNLAEKAGSVVPPVVETAASLASSCGHETSREIHSKTSEAQSVSLLKAANLGVAFLGSLLKCISISVILIEETRIEKIALENASQVQRKFLCLLAQNGHRCLVLSPENCRPLFEIH